MPRPPLMLERLAPLAMPLPSSSREAWRLPGARAEALLIHGFTSTPWEVRFVGDVLSSRGIASHGVLLPGHGTDPSHLDTLTRREWLDAVRDAFAGLDPSKPRFVVGASMGGLLAILLAGERPRDIAGLALLAPALDLFPSGVLGGALARVGAHRRGGAITKSERGGDIADGDARALNPTYPVIPWGGLAEFDRLRDDAKAALPRVTVPTLVLHGAHDRTVRPSSARLVAERVRAPFVDRELLVRSQHILGVDQEREHVARRVLVFVERLLHAQVPPVDKEADEHLDDDPRRA